MIGLLPAAGQATRMNGLPKYLLPIPGGGHLMQRHVEAMELAGLTHCIHEARHSIFIPTSRWNWPYITSQGYSRDKAYIATNHDTMAETVLSMSYRDEPALFGMPDTYIENALPYIELADALNEGTQVVVGLFRARPGQHAKVGMCRIEGEHVVGVIDKPESTDLEWLWGVLAWQPVFWDCIKPEDPHVGYAIPRAITAGLDVRAVFMEGRYFDCGTPEQYFECIRAITSEA